MLDLPNKKPLEEFAKKNLIRHRRIIADRFDTLVKVDGKWVIHFCSNDYLNIAIHPEVKKAFAKAARQYGLGSGSSNLISGYTETHHALEEAFAEHLQRSRAIFFNSGYHANLGVLQTFAQRDSIVISDKLCHASLIDGIVLSRAKHFRYAHHAFAQAEQLLQTHHAKKKCLVTESVFSMEGDITDVKHLSMLAEQYAALLIVDDAHGFATLGHGGKGICDYFNLTEHDVPLLITPLGKGLGASGAMVSGPKDFIENLIQFARTYRYTISLPPAVSAGALAALRIIQQEPERPAHLRHLALFFNQCAEHFNLTLAAKDPTPIKCIMVGSNKKVAELQQQLFHQGFLVSGIRPPTVPNHTARIRITLNYCHTENQITQLLTTIHTILNG